MRKTFFAKKLQVENNVKGKYIEKNRRKNVNTNCLQTTSGKNITKKKTFFSVLTLNIEED